MTTLPASGVITLGDVNVALGLARPSFCKDAVRGRNRSYKFE